MPLELTVGTFNIHHGVGTDGVLDIGRIAQIIADAGLDIAGLQEVDQNFGARSGWLDQPLEIERLSSRFVTFGPTISHRGRNYGNAIVSKDFVIKSSAHLYRGWPSREPRGFVYALIGTWPRPVHAISTHFGLAKGERVSQARELAHFLRSLEGPVLVFGDLNERPDGDAVAELRKTLVSATTAETPTFPSVQGVPGVQIDYILLSPDFQVKTVRAEASPASDHLALIASVALETRWTRSEKTTPGRRPNPVGKKQPLLTPIP